MKVQKAGFQNQAGEVLLEKGGSASVRGWYTRTVLSKFASDAMPNTLRSNIFVIKVRFFELPYNEGSKQRAFRIEKMERYLRKAEAQV